MISECVSGLDGEQAVIPNPSTTFRLEPFLLVFSNGSITLETEGTENLEDMSPMGSTTPTRAFQGISGLFYARAS